MSATVAAALKKIAVALLTDKKVVKKVGIFALSILVVIFMPIGVILGICNTEIEFDEDDLAAIADTLDAEEIAKLALIQEKLDEIEEAMEEADMHSRYEEAQLLYMLALYEYQDEDHILRLLLAKGEQPRY